MRREPPSRLRATAVMWSAVGLFGIILALVLGRGWGPSALSFALGLLFLSCFSACVWAFVTHETSSRFVEEEIEKLADKRRAGVEAAEPTDPGKRRLG